MAEWEAATHATQAATILIVEDDHSIHVLLHDMMSSAGYVPIVAETGAAVLKALEQDTIDLMALDLMLPDIHGHVAPQRGDPGQQGVAALGGVLLVYLDWTGQGPAEELRCRGFLLQTICSR